MTISVVTQIAITGAAFVKVTLMLTVTLTEKTGICRYSIQDLRGEWVFIISGGILCSYLQLTIIKELWTEKKKEKNTLLVGCDYWICWRFVLVIVCDVYHDITVMRDYIDNVLSTVWEKCMYMYLSGNLENAVTQLRNVCHIRNIVFCITFLKHFIIRNL